MNVSKALRQATQFAGHGAAGCNANAMQMQCMCLPALSKSAEHDSCLSDAGLPDCFGAPKQGRAA
jgi:hypothetical protein